MNDIKQAGFMLDKTKMREKLIELMACSDAREWAEGKSLEQVWIECHRGDWMLWLAKRAGVDKRTMTLAKGRCAELVKHLMKDARSINAVEVSISYGLGNSTDEELAAAAAAAAAAYAAADAYAYAAADADAYAYAAAAADAYAAADAAAAAAADADAYAYAAAAAAADAYTYAAAAAAADAYAAAARNKMRQMTADAVRAVITVEMLKL